MTYLTDYQEYYNTLTPAYTNIPGEWSLVTDDFVAYYKDHKLHNLDGPAYKTSDGVLLYFKNGVPHNLDGPAVVFPKGVEWDNDTIPFSYEDYEADNLDDPKNDDKDYYEYRIDGLLYSKEDFLKKVKTFK